jgi:hypothetical protein
MITMQELLEDKKFREFMTTKPKVPVSAQHSILSPMWVVYVRLHPNQAWKRRSFERYSEAFKFMKVCLGKSVHDLAIHNKRVAFDPPRKLVRIKGKFVTGPDGVQRQATKFIDWQPKLLGVEETHEWCMYCRRPTVFKRYSKHPAIQKDRPASLWDIPLDDSVRRCCICGCSERIAIPWQRRRF